MATETIAVSDSPKSSAGETANKSLDAAFDAAFESVDQEETTFAPAVKPAGKPPAKEAKSNKPVDDSVVETAAPVVAGDEAETDEGKVEPVAPAAISAPAHWDAARREAFNKLPPDAQKVMLDLAKGVEAAATKTSMEAANDRKFASSIRSLISDNHRAQLTRAGMDEVGGIKHLLNLQDYATRDAPGYIRWAVEQMRLDPRQIFPQLAGDDQQAGYETPPQVDPHVQQLSEAYQQLSAQVNGFYQQQANQQNEMAESAITDFRSAVDASGQPTHPHFDKVERDMIWILQSDPAIKAIKDLGQRLTRAYDLAVYRDPEIKNQIVDSEVQRRMAEAQKQRDLAKAKKAQAPIMAATPANPTSAKPKTLDEATRQSFQQLGV